MDTFNAFNPEPEVEKSRWFTGPTFTTFLIGIIIGFSVNSFFGGSLFSDANDGADNGDSSPTEESASLGELLGDAKDAGNNSAPLSGEKKAPLATVADGENIFVVSNQPAGERVIVSMVSVSLGGWVAVYETNAEGALGNILGARRFNAGKYFGETIDLLRGTTEDGVYAIVLHSDDGDGEFDYTREVPVKDKKGDLVSGTFTATGLLTE